MAPRSVKRGYAGCELRDPAACGWSVVRTSGADLSHKNAAIRLQLWRWQRAHRQISLELSEHSLEYFSALYTFLNICTCSCVKLLISANQFCNTIFIAKTMTGLHNKPVYSWIGIVFQALVHTVRKKELQEQFKLHIGLHAYSTVTFLKYTWCVGI